MASAQAAYNYDAEQRSTAKTRATLEKLLSRHGYDALVIDTQKSVDAIREGVRASSSVSVDDDEVDAIIQVVLRGLKLAVKRTDWRLGYGKVRDDATVPEVAATLACDAVTLLEEAFSPRGMQAYRNRHRDFIDAMAEFAEQANGGIAGHMDFYGKLGRQVAQAVLDHNIAPSGPELAPVSIHYPEITAAAMEQMVYFIRAGEDGPIKIGIARDPANRLATLQTGHHATLRIVALTAGGSAQEAAYHAHFKAHRLRGEWFDPHPDILAEIERLSPTPTKDSSHGY
jgi:hypothetical protein